MILYKNVFIKDKEAASLAREFPLLSVVFFAHSALENPAWRPLYSSKEVDKGGSSAYT